MGVLMGKITWVCRALVAMDLLLKNESGKLVLTGGRERTMEDIVKGHELLPLLGGQGWRCWSKLKRDGWFLRLKEERTECRSSLAAEEVAWKDREREKRYNAFIREGVNNSKAFHRMRLARSREPDGEAIKDEDGSILVLVDEIIQRYGKCLLCWT